MMNKGIYKNLPRHLHLEPTSDCNARCPQCPRTFKTSMLTNPLLDINEWSAEELKKVLDDNYFKNLKKILINGNYGDIVKHSHPKELLEVIISYNLEIEIRTNGGALTTDFWKWLGKQPNVLVEFGIDGLEDTHHLYRRNTRFDIVIKNAKAYINSGGKASWAMTVFKHNEHQVKKCKKLSEKIGFKFFKSRSSTRWNTKNLIILDKNFEKEYVLEPASNVEKNYNNLPEHKPGTKEVDFNNEKDFNLESIPKFQNKTNIQKVNCVVQNSSSVYLSADKKIWPCCWIGNNVQNAIMNKTSSSFVEKFFRELKYDIDFNNVLKYSISDIINSGLFLEIEKSWKGSNIFDECSIMCAKNSNWNIQQKQTKVDSLGNNKK